MRRIIGVLMMIMFAACLGIVAQAQGGTTVYQVIETIDLGGEQQGNVNWADVSEDGRYLVYQIYTPSKFILFDRLTNEKRSLMKYLPPSTHGENAGFISHDGEYVAFAAVSINHTHYIYVINTNTDQFERLLLGANGQPLETKCIGDVCSGELAVTDISPDGRFMTYFASVSNPFDNQNIVCQDYMDKQFCYSVFLYDRLTKQQERISINNYGDIANNHSFESRVSADGRYVFFESYGTNLDTACEAGDICGYLYVRDRKTQTTKVAIKDAVGQPTGGLAYLGGFQVNSDARYVAFLSDEQNLIVGGTVAFENMFVRDLETKTNELVSVPTSGEQLTYNFSGGSREIEISQDGQLVIFPSTNIRDLTDNPAGCFPPDEVLGCPVGLFLHNRVTNETFLLNSLDGSVGNLTGFSAIPHIASGSDEVMYADNQGKIYISAPSNTTLPRPNKLKAKVISNSQIDLKWIDNTGGTSIYHIERSLDGLTQWKEVGVTPIGATTFSDTTAACGARYFYRVYAVNETDGTKSGRSFYANKTIPTCVLPPLALTSPNDGTIVNTLTPVLAWEHLPSAVWYRVVIQDKNGLPVIDHKLKEDTFASVCVEGTCSFDLGAAGYALSDATFQWKVIAKTVSGLKTHSSSWTLKVDVPGAPLLISPANHAENVLLSPALTWSIIPNATTYTVTIARNGNAVFSHTVDTAVCDLDDCTLDTTGLVTLKAGKTYKWFVKAESAIGKSKSATWRFTTTGASLSNR